MPIVEIKLVAGRDEAAIKRCVKAVARTIHESLGAPLETIRVIAIQVPAQQWAIATRHATRSRPQGMPVQELARPAPSPDRHHGRRHQHCAPNLS